ncbi:MAG: HAMP domain-containing histidine kinase [Deltaproteobacteria bacterium]|nr:HAMP domain-containing histidine kinase [Deltaproteobacteria bacterium]
MNRSRWLFHPILILVFSILALGTSLFLYIYWYIEASSGLRAIVERFNLDAGQVLASQTWVVILVLSLLVGIIFMGIFIIFVYNLKTLQLYRLQHNFINNFTHELKTPVTALKLYLETFIKHELSREDQIKYIRYMLNDAGRLSDNINRILNLAQIESKSFSGELEPHNLVDVVKRFLTKNAHHFQDYRVTVFNPSGGPYHYSINAPLFDMFLMNILTNAVKYNQSDKPEVQISFEAQGKKLYINFKDNGIGIEKKERRKIFRKFYQIGRADDMSAKGSGLGLFLVEQIAKIHKGKIRVSSQGLGKGSTFSLILPLKYAA